MGIIRLSKRLRYGAAAGLFTLAVSFSGLAGLVPQTVSAAGEGFYAVDDKSMTTGDTLAITDLQIAGGNGSDQLDLTLKASGGTIDFDTVDGGLTSINGTGSDYVMMTGTSPQINATLSTMQYSDDGVGEKTITAELGNNVGDVLWNDGEGGNGHAYIVLNQTMTWQQAKDKAETYTFGGQQGYLATITDQVENDFVYEAIDGQTGWIGATDLENGEGEWYWRTGPEAGTKFWAGNFNGSAFNGAYTNWDEGEPNNSDLNEHCGQFWEAGTWNDIGCTTPRPFVVEFGGDEDNLPQPVRRELNITVTGATHNIGSCAALLELDSHAIMHDTINLTADIDCADEETAYNDSIFAKSEDWDAFHGAFNGHGYAIRNLELTSEGGPLGLFGYTDGATFTNLNLENLDYGAGGYVGGLVGQARNTSFTNITLNNVKIGAGNRAGGLAGYMGSGTINNVHITNVDIEAEGYGGLAGGLVGDISPDGGGDPSSDIMTIYNASVSGGTVKGSGDVGGLFGRAEVHEWGRSMLIEKVYSNVEVIAENSWAGGLMGGFYAITNDNSSNADLSITLKNAYSWSSVTAGGNYVGGLIGQVEARNAGSGTSTLVVQNTYAKGTVTGDEHVAGLFGYFWVDNGSDVTIANNFAKGNVTVGEGASQYGGLVGEVGGNAWENTTFSGNYFDQTGTGQSACNEVEELPNCTAVNANGSQPNYFINNNTNAPMNTWDFDTIWVANAGNTPTFQPVVDEDNDGIDDAIENTAPNNGDGNNDGTPDSAQSHVASLISPVSGKYITLVVDESCNLSDVSIASESGHSAQDGIYDYQAGFVTFTASGCDDDQTSVTLYYHDVASSSHTVRKYNPNTNTYFTITTASIASLGNPLSGTQVSYTIADNSELDINNEEGVITDPVGLGSPAAASSGSGLAGTGQPRLIVLIKALLVLGGSAVLWFSLRQKLSSR